MHGSRRYSRGRYLKQSVHSSPGDAFAAFISGGMETKDGRIN
jgi:hypothetical protein